MPFGDYTLLLSHEGGLWAFGYNRQGQLGLGHTNNQLEAVEVDWSGPQPVQVDWGEEHSLVLDVEGGVWEAGRSWSSSSSPTFQQVQELPYIALVAAGTSRTGLSWAHSLPQRVEGFPPLIKVTCFHYGVILVDSQGGIFSSGDNCNGTLSG